MKRFSLILAFSFAVLHTAVSHAGERKLYVGKDSTEAKLEFNASLTVSGDRPGDEQAKNWIENQVTFLFGTLSNAVLTAAPRGDHTITVTGIKKTDDGRWQIGYAYQGTIAIQKDASNSKAFQLQIYLPRDPYNVSSNSCGDGEHDSDAFWWVFNPKKPGCDLAEGKDYDGVVAKVTRILTPATTYPEYSRLVDSEGNITIDVLMGVAGEEFNETTLNPLAGENYDESAANFRMIRSTFLQLGFTERQWPADDIAKFAGVSESNAPFVTELTKKEKKATLKIRMFFGVTNVGRPGAGWFYQFLADSLKNHSIMIYSGHSSLGQGLDLNVIESYLGSDFHLYPNKDRYQIYYFNGCSSYGYYNQDYFGRKATPADPTGTANLEVLTNGLSTYFYTMGPSDLYFLKAVMAWADGKGSVSYQTLAEKIDSGNLFGVNGDTDPGNLKP